MLLEIGNQRSAVFRPLGRLTEAVQLQFDAFQAQVIPQTGAHQDQFRVDIRSAHAEGFHPDLMELPVAPLLRPLVAEHLAHVIQPLRLPGRQVVLDHRPHATGRAFRAQSQGFAIQAIDEGVHFLLDNIGHFPDRPLEQWRRLDDGHADGPVAVALQPAADGVFEQLPECRFFRQDVVHPAHGLQTLTHADNFFL